MPGHTNSPGLVACCGAVIGTVKGAVRPRRPDRRFLATLVDAGLPKTDVVVSVSPLRQIPRSVPTTFIVEGRHQPSRIDNTLASFVVTHPDATFIVDPGVSLDVRTRVISQLPAALRVVMRTPPGTVATVTALAERGPNAPRLDFALPTHAHWDHVCGLLDLPDLPVHLHTQERDWVMAGPVAPVGGVRDSLVHRETVGYDLDGPPVLTFARSHDLFGDGSVVLVDLAGHTPGSVGVLLHTATGWTLLAGDAVWHHYQLDDIRQKSAYPGGFADDDRDVTFRTLHRLHAVKDRVAIVATHDHHAVLQLRSRDRISAV